MPKSYRILEQGTKPNGNTWARYIDSQGVEVKTEVAAGLDLETHIQASERYHQQNRERWAALTPAEQQTEIEHERQRREHWGNDWG